MEDEVLAICQKCHRTEFGYAEFRASRCACGGLIVVARTRDLLQEGAMWTLVGEVPSEELERLRREAVRLQPRTD